MSSEVEKQREEFSHEGISPTAWGVAYRKTLTDIPFSHEIFDELQEELKEDQRDVDKLERLKAPELTPMFEARYKLVNRLLREHGVKQIIEIAAGLSSRGITMTEDPSMKYVEVDLLGMMNKKKKINRSLIEKKRVPSREHLYLETGNALRRENLERAAEHF